MCGLIDQAGSTEIGLMQRFLWIILGLHTHVSAHWTKWIWILLTMLVGARLIIILSILIVTQTHIMFTTKLIFTTCVSRVVDLLCREWLPGKVTKPKPRTFIVSQASDAFVAHFDKVQEQLETIFSMDELVTGETNQALSHCHIYHMTCILPVLVNHVLILTYI